MSGELSPDVVARAKAALKYAPELPWEVRSDFDPMTGVNTYFLENIERFRGLRNNVYCGTDVHLAEFIAAARSLIPELVAEIERLRMHLESVPSAIQAYADAELTSVSYEMGEPVASPEDKLHLAGERETLLRFQRNADDIVAYAATAVKP